MTDQHSASAGEHEQPVVLLAYSEGVAVLDLVGEHDLATAPQITKQIREQTMQNRNVVVSLKDADFIDSSVVATLFRGHHDMSLAGYRLVLHTDCDAHILRTLQLTGVPDGLLCRTDLDEAIALARGELNQP